MTAMAQGRAVGPRRLGQPHRLRRWPLLHRLPQHTFPAHVPVHTSPLHTPLPHILHSPLNTHLPLHTPSPRSLCCTPIPCTRTLPRAPALSSHLDPCAHVHTPCPSNTLWFTQRVHTAGTHSTYVEQLLQGAQAPAHPATHSEPPTHPWCTHSLLLSLPLTGTHATNTAGLPSAGLTPRTGEDGPQASEAEDSGSRKAAGRCGRARSHLVLALSCCGGCWSQRSLTCAWEPTPLSWAPAQAETPRQLWTHRQAG